jgi:hypothetical protein
VSCPRDFSSTPTLAARAAELHKQVEKLKADKAADRGIHEATGS